MPSGSDCDNWRQAPPGTEHDATPAADGTFVAHCTAVMGDWRKPCQSSGLFARDLADLGKFRDQHPACYRAIPFDRTKEAGSVRNARIGCDGGLDLGFQIGDLHAK